MSKFPELDKSSDDELINVVFIQKDEWQKEAVEYASYLLEQRGLTIDYCHKRTKELYSEYTNYLQEEFNSRKFESYGFFELILKVIFWPNLLLTDWRLRKDGYTKKYKQRLIAIGVSILIYSLFFASMQKQMKNTNKEFTEYVEEKAKADSIFKSKIDWSGEYLFSDHSVNNNRETIWKLSVKKSDSGHFGRLRITSGLDLQEILCEGIIDGEKIVFYPDTNYVLANGKIITYYDNLFTIEKYEDRLYTLWGKMKPFNSEAFDGTGIFVEKEIN